MRNGEPGGPWVECRCVRTGPVSYTHLDVYKRQIKDPAALAAAILRLFEDRELAARCGQAARERVELNYSLTERARDHLRLFEKLVIQRGR